MIGIRNYIIDSKIGVAQDIGNGYAAGKINFAVVVAAHVKHLPDVNPEYRFNLFFAHCPLQIGKFCILKIKSPAHGEEGKKSFVDKVFIKGAFAGKVGGIEITVYDAANILIVLLNEQGFIDQENLTLLS